MDYRNLSNPALLGRLRLLAGQERISLVDFLACMEETDRRDAALEEGFSSLFEFCVKDLRLAESTAYQRVQVARAARDRPEIYSLLSAGAVNMTNLTLIASNLRVHPSLLDRIVNKTKREVEAIVAEVSETLPRRESIRIVGTARPSPQPAEPGLFDHRPAPAVLPAASAVIEHRAEVQFTVGKEFVAAIEKLRNLLWHKFPAGRLEDILYEAARDFIERRAPERPRKGGHEAASNPSSRKIAAGLRREVWNRDQGRCTFVGPAGRCGSERGLEIDHIQPWALGGRSDDAANLRLLCRAHNQLEARRRFGEPSAGKPPD